MARSDIPMAAADAPMPDGWVRVDIIGLFLRERIPYVLPVAEVVRRIRAQGGLVDVPHPSTRCAAASATPPPACARTGWSTSSRFSTPR
jgi:hypothetical protein